MRTTACYQLLVRAGREPAISGIQVLRPANYAATLPLCNGNTAPVLDEKDMHRLYGVLMT